MGGGGDSYEIYRRMSDGSDILRWVLVFDTEPDALESFDIIYDIVPEINSGLILIDDSMIDHRVKWKRGENLFYVERHGRNVIVLFNIPRDLFSQEVQLLRTTRTVKGVPDIPKFGEQASTATEELPSFSLGNTFPVDLSGGTMNRLSYTLSEENVILKLPSTRWNMKIEKLNGSLTFLMIENEDSSVKGQLQLLRFPIPIDVQTLAMSMELGASMVESATGAKKVKAGILQINTDTAYEMVLQKSVPGSGGTVINQANLFTTE